MASDLVAVALEYGRSIVSRVYTPQENITNPISREVEDAQFELSCIGRPRFLRPLYRMADSIGLSSPGKRVNNMVSDVENSIGVLERRIEIRSKELTKLEKKYDSQKRAVISKRAEAKSALEKGKTFLKNGKEPNEKDELLNLANTYLEYRETGKLIEEYQSTIRWLEEEKERQKDKAIAIKRLFHEGKTNDSQQ